MTVPLIVLAVFAACLGWGGVLPDWFYRFVGDSQAMAATHHAWQPVVISIGFTLNGLLAGVLVYGLEPLRAGQVDRLEAGMRRVRLGWLYDALYHRFYFDELYQATLVRGVVGLARVCAGFDRRVPDGVIGLVAWVGRATSRAAGRFDALTAGGAANLVAWAGRAVLPAISRFDEIAANSAANLVALAGRAASRAVSRFDETGMDKAVNLIARVGRAASQAAGRFDALVVGRAISLVGQAVRALAELGALLDPRVLAPLANVAGDAARTLSSASGSFDARIVDGVVEEVGSAVRAGGRFIRPIQTGRVQNYILVAFISVLVLVVMYFTMVYFAWW